MSKKSVLSEEERRRFQDIWGKIANLSEEQVDLLTGEEVEETRGKGNEASCGRWTRMC